MTAVRVPSDCSLNTTQHISFVSRTCYFHLCQMMELAFVFSFKLSSPLESRILQLCPLRCLPSSTTLHYNLCPRLYALQLSSYKVPEVTSCLHCNSYTGLISLSKSPSSCIMRREIPL